MAEFLVCAMNTSAGSWDVSPLFSLMERKKARKKWKLNFF